MFTPDINDGELRWLDDAACADLEISDFFVEAGHVIAEDALEICRSCPVRNECIRHAYKRGIVGGYFGGLSPGQRRDLDLEGALEYAKNDAPAKTFTREELLARAAAARKARAEKTAESEIGKESILEEELDLLEEVEAEY